MITFKKVVMVNLLPINKTFHIFVGENKFCIFEHLNWKYLIHSFFLLNMNKPYSESKIACKLERRNIWENMTSCLWYSLWHKRHVRCPHLKKKKYLNINKIWIKLVYSHCHIYQLNNNILKSTVQPRLKKL